jgi:DNA phosphorothioation-dependent restriction protein DptG
MGHQRAIVETRPEAQTGSSREQVCRVLGGNVTEFLRKTRESGAVVKIAEYVVMLFVAVMTGVSTLRLLGILP